MNQELLAIIGTAITLGVAMFGSTRSLRKSIERTEDRLKAEMKTNVDRLDAAIAGVRADMRDGDAALRAEIRESESRLRAEIEASEGRLEGAIAGVRSDMKEGDAALCAEMKAGEAKLEDIGREMRAGFTNVTQRIARLEGVIEGRSPEARDQPREGVA